MALWSRLHQRGERLLLSRRAPGSLLNKLGLTEGELAALIGHEVGHVLHRLSQKCVAQQLLLSAACRQSLGAR